MDTKLRVLLFAPLLAVGVVSFVVVRSQQGEGATLGMRQQSAAALTPAAVDRAVQLAPESVHGPRGRSAHCVPGPGGELRNPWRCTIDYADGKVVGYRVTINADGSYVGDDQAVTYRGRTVSAPARITGCCITIP